MIEASQRLPTTATRRRDAGTAEATLAAADAFECLQARLAARTATVGVIGLGYVGLPLAHAFCQAGFPVLGLDIDADKVARLAKGQSYIGHLGDDLVRTMNAQGLEATNQFQRLDEVEAVVICVPTPLTEAREPDLSFVLNSVYAVAAHLRPGSLVVLESTTYPGTTRQVVLPLLETKGRQAGRDFFLAFSPEREDPGNAAFSTGTIPKVVGGLEPRSLELAAQLYAPLTAVVRVSSPEVAEACKILENTYRAVNIALVNELKALYERMGIDIWEVIDAAKTKPFGFQPFYPGPGLGGHCIPIDPFYLAWVAKKHGRNARFIELAGEINTAMPAYVVEHIADALNASGQALRGSKITLLGMAYKKDVDDCRESPGLELLEMLVAKGAEVHYNDPHIPRLPRTRRHPSWDLSSHELSADYLHGRDCLVIVTDHSAYDWPHLLRHARLIVDTRGVTRGLGDGAARVVRA